MTSTNNYKKKLIEVAIPHRVRHADVHLLVNDRDVTSALRYDQDTRSLVGLVTGLRLGDNEIAAFARNART